eukprot:3712629-Amphidinium_carterae.1
MHVQDGFEWTPTLALTCKQCLRALGRGLGPPARAPELKECWLRDGAEQVQGVCPEDCAHPFWAWAVAC